MGYSGYSWGIHGVFRVFMGYSGYSWGIQTEHFGVFSGVFRGRLPSARRWGVVVALALPTLGGPRPSVGPGGAVLVAGRYTVGAVQPQVVLQGTPDRRRQRVGRSPD